MSGRFEAGYYEDLQAQMRVLTLSVSGLIEPEDRSFVEELVDHDESGLALEILIEALVECGAPLAGTVVRQIEGLVQQMELPPELAESARALEVS